MYAKWAFSELIVLLARDRSEAKNAGGGPEWIVIFCLCAFVALEEGGVNGDYGM